MSKKAIIFDLDGVIVDTAKYHYKAWLKIANDLGFDFSEKENENLKGVSRVESLDFLLKRGDVKLSQLEKDRLLVAKNEHYLSLISNMDKSELLPGIKDLLSALNNENIPYALGSASKNAKRILRALHLTDMFNAIVDGTDVTRSKPDPEVFEIAANRLNYSYTDCIVIEDSIAGIEAANSIQMTSVGIGDQKALKHADHILENTNRLTIDFIKEIINQ